ncbi:kinase-like domain-containing protein [Fennellomyces sp. T-0311]|nr:kinase-like domain-containing protein [Fennellomyces sp. T-0311]
MNSQTSNGASRSTWLQDKDNERTDSPDGSPEGTKYYSFSQTGPDESSTSKKRPQSTPDHEGQKFIKTENGSERSPTEPFSPDPAQFEEHDKAWGYLQALNATLPSGYLEKVSYNSSGRTGYMIGRGYSSDFRCDSREISKQHCLIYMESGDDGVAKGISVYLEDLSSNGTYVNGRPVGKNERKLLHNGDFIQLVRKTKYADDDIRGQYYRIILPPQYEVGVFYDDHHLGRLLGRGNFANVYKARNKKTKEIVAVKVISKSKFIRRPKMLPSIIQEVAILMSLENHPCVIKIGKVYNEPKYVYFILEYVPDGELFDYVVARKYLSENETRFVFCQLFSAIDFLHSKGIAHRDLKPENVLLVDKQKLHVKVTDFGLAKLQQGTSPFLSQCGTPNYVAPEILSPNGLRAYGKECDLWSLGVMLYICLCGFPPFNEELAPPPMKEQIKRGIYDFPEPYWNKVSSEAKDLIKQLLTVDPDKRIKIKEVMQHPWMLMEVSISQNVF